MSLVWTLKKQFFYLIFYDFCLWWAYYKNFSFQFFFYIQIRYWLKNINHANRCSIQKRHRSKISHWKNVTENFYRAKCLRTKVSPRAKLILRAKVSPRAKVTLVQKSRRAKVSTRAKVTLRAKVKLVQKFRSCKSDPFP